MIDRVDFTSVNIDCAKIVDWPSFHSTFKEALGFPDFYGNNMSAWVDCMTCLDDPDAEMSRIHAPPKGVVVLELHNVKSFRSRCSEQYDAIVECSAFVNWLLLEKRDPPVLVLSFYN